MLCTVCGTLNDDSLQICSKCGNNMTFHTQEHYEYHQVFNQQPDTQPKQPNYQQPNYQQPNYQQPNYQQPNYQQPNYQQPNYQQPNYQQPNYQQPNYQQPNYQQPNYQQAYYQPNPYYPQPEKKDPGKVLGIVGFCLSMACFVMSYTIAMPIAGLILSAIGFKKSKEAGFNNAFAKAGLIIGIIFTVFTVLLVAFVLLIYAIMFLTLPYSAI